MKIAALVSIVLAFAALASAAAAPTAAPPVATLAMTPGEIVLTPAQHDAVAKLIATDPEARALYQGLLDKARLALGAEPDPIADIKSEGKLKGDPIKTKSLESAQDLPKMEALAWAASFSSPADAKPFYDKAREFLLAWAAVNHSDGDPIDDTLYEPALRAYDLSRSTLNAGDRSTIEQWLAQIATAEERTGHWNTNPRWNNWNSHRLKIVGLIAFLLEAKDAQARVQAAYKDQIDHNLNANGTTYDFIERDALHYHVYDMEPLLELDIAARENGVDLYDETAITGGSLAKSLDFLVPFCDGAKTHPEFVNSKVGFDRARARNGETKYITGRLYDPTEAINVLSLGAAFDPKYAEVERNLKTPPPTRFATWRDVLNAAQAR